MKNKIGLKIVFSILLLIVFSGITLSGVGGNNTGSWSNPELELGSWIETFNEFEGNPGAVINANGNTGQWSLSDFTSETPNELQTNVYKTPYGSGNFNIIENTDEWGNEIFLSDLNAIVIANKNVNPAESIFYFESTTNDGKNLVVLGKVDENYNNPGQDHGGEAEITKMYIFEDNEHFVDNLFEEDIYEEFLEDNPQFHDKIQDAIDSADEGDVINVAEGLYEESILIDKGITLQGEGKDKTFIKSDQTPLITISADNVEIKDLELTDDNELVEGIKVTSTSELIIKNIDFTNIGNSGNNAYGIKIENSFENFYVIDSDFISVEHDTSSRGIGIFAGRGYNLLNFEINGSNFERLFVGIYLSSDINDLDIIDNTFGPFQLNDCTTAVAGIYIGDGEDYNFDIQNLNISGNIFTEYGRGIYVWNYGANAIIKNIDIYENTFANSIWSSGIRIIAGIGEDEKISLDNINLFKNEFTQDSEVGANVALIDLRNYCELALSSEIDIYNNEIIFSGENYEDAMYGIAFSALEGPFNDVDVENNILNGGNTGGEGDPSSSGVTIRHESSVYWPEDSLEININENTIIDFDYGVSVYDSTNSQYGGLTEDSEVDATENYWGTLDKTTIEGLISGDVTYSPWYDETFTTKYYGLNEDGSAEAEEEDGSITITPTEGSSDTIIIDIENLTSEGVDNEDTVGLPGLGKYLRITSDLSNKNIDSIKIKIYYSDDELGDIAEEDLVIYYYNTTVEKWLPVTTIEGNYGVNTEENYVWAITDHLTDFGAFEDGEGPLIEFDHLSKPYPNPNDDDFTIYAYANITDPSDVKDYPELKWKITDREENTVFDTGQTTMNPLNGLYYGGITAPKLDGLEILYQIIAEDEFGNSATNPSNYDHLFYYDGLAPETSITIGNPKYPNNADTYITSTTSFELSCDDGVNGNGCNNTYYKINENALSEYQTPFSLSNSLLDEEHRINYYSKDNSENIENENIQLVILDNTKPITSDDSSSEWTNTNVQIELTPNDGQGSGIANTVFCTQNMGDDDCQPNTPYNTPIPISCDDNNVCQKQIRYFSVDNLGNQEVTKNSNQINIDKKLPQFTEIDGTEQGPVSSDTINIEVIDESLDSSSLKYGFSLDNVCDSGDLYNEDFTNGEDFVIAGNENEDYLCLIASDLAGNTNYNLVGKLNIDGTSPELNDITIYSNNEYDNLAKITDTVTLEFTSNEEIQNIVVTIDGETVTATETEENDGMHWTASLELDSGNNEGEIQFTINYQDLAENSGTTITSTTDESLVLFDKTDPLGELIDVPTDWTNQDAILTLSCTDENGCNEDKFYLDIVQYNEECNVNTLYSSYDGDISVLEHSTACWKVTDNAGNTATGESEIKVDQINPEVEDNYTNSDNWVVGNQSILLTASDLGGSGINKILHCEGVSCNPSEELIGGVLKYEGTTEKTIRYKTIDNAGNPSDTEEFIIKIDQVLPEIEDDYEYDGQWINAEPTVTITATDLGSGINYIKYCYGAECDPAEEGTQINTNIHSLSFSEDGSIIVRYQAWDAMGTESLIGSFNVSIDTINPIINAISPGGELSTNGIILYVKTTDEKTLCRYGTTLEEEFDDMSYPLGSEISEEIEHIKEVTLEDGNYYYRVKCKDKANNEVAEVISFSIDTSDNFDYFIDFANGWNQFDLPYTPLLSSLGYITEKQRSISNVLSSIEGNYKEVWHYDGTRWVSYNPDVPELSTLQEFSNDENDNNPYWINMKTSDRLELIDLTELQ